MTDPILTYRACGAECREDWLRMLANDNGLPLECVQRLADRLGEREDFGAIYQLGDGRWTATRPARRDDERESVFWKLDYFDLALEFASEDAADPRITRLVLTIMLASEY